MDLFYGPNNLDFKKRAVQVAGWTGLEPAASALTGQRSNQLNYHPPINRLFVVYRRIICNI